MRPCVALVCVLLFAAGFQDAEAQRQVAPGAGRSADLSGFGGVRRTAQYDLERRVKTLPAVREALEQRAWDEARQQIPLVAATLERDAAEVERAAAALE